jgi:hypothetical protein
MMPLYGPREGDETMKTETTYLHEFLLSGDYACQVGREVRIFKKGQDSRENPVKVLAPPAEWLDRWTWNFAEDGNGITLAYDV